MNDIKHWIIRTPRADGYQMFSYEQTVNSYCVPNDAFEIWYDAELCKLQVKQYNDAEIKEGRYDGKHSELISL